MSNKKGNPFKLPGIHTLDIMNCLFMQLPLYPGSGKTVCVVVMLGAV
jgi:hypothetical protein